MDEVLTTGDASSMMVPSTTMPFNNLPLLSALLAGFLSQFLKIFTTWYKEKRWTSKKLFDSGGMPSSHSAAVTALASCYCYWVSRWDRRIFISPCPGFCSCCKRFNFNLQCNLFSLVMHDASGLRLHAGMQAELLNQIVCELPQQHPLSNVRPLRDSLGHTPCQIPRKGFECDLNFFFKPKKTEN
ncbi:hypothetical protein MKX01_026911 [Papaver californicum]|nr:hypothetical protein MKX01_026911 [Papaver californicum]